MACNGSSIVSNLSLDRFLEFPVMLYNIFNAFAMSSKSVRDTFSAKRSIFYKLRERVYCISTLIYIYVFYILCLRYVILNGVLNSNSFIAVFI